MRRTFAIASALVASLALVLVGTLTAQAQPDKYETARRAASDSGLTLGPIPDGELRVDALPDLIPLEATSGEVIGYIRAEDAFLDAVEPGLDIVALPVYEADGKTLIGHEIPGEGFVASTTPRATSVAAIIPEKLTTIPEGMLVTPEAMALIPEEMPNDP